MIKSVLNNSFNFDQAVADLVPLHRRNADRGWMSKRAVSPLFDFSTLRGEPNETLIHMLALGDGETTGANRNGDYFSKAANVRKHHTFLKAGYFHNHVNHDMSKALGRVVASAHNDDMGRVELVVALNNDKCAKDLEQLEQDGSFPVSMSCHVGYDVCSICGNKASRRADYCKHASQQLGAILGDGRQVYVDNPDPDFFDISKVWRPADRVAYTFKRLDKAAAAGRVIGGAELAEVLNDAIHARPLSDSRYAIAKVATQRRLAEAVKQAQQHPQLQRAVSRVQLSDEDLKVLKAAADQDALFGALHRAGVCLDIETFGQLVNLPGNTKQALKKVAGALTSGQVCNNGAYDGTRDHVSLSVTNAITRVAKISSFLRSDVGAELLTNVALREQKTHEKYANAHAEAADSLLAEQYAAYLLAFAHNIGNGENARGQFAQNLTAIRALA